MMDAMWSHACRSLKHFLADSAWNVLCFMMAPSNVFKLILSMFKCMGTPWETTFHPVLIVNLRVVVQGSFKSESLATFWTFMTGFV